MGARRSSVLVPEKAVGETGRGRNGHILELGLAGDDRRIRALKDPRREEVHGLAALAAGMRDGAGAVLFLAAEFHLGAGGLDQGGLQVAVSVLGKPEPEIAELARAMS